MSISWIRKEFITLRTQQGITQKELSNRAKTGINTVYNFETKRSNPRLDNLCKWLDVLGYEIDIHKK
tara:strand:+ start:195 stop:395 length:201 start_codon:yes stop_codon:yes gene_type:complete